MFPIVIVVVALTVLVHIVSGSRTVRLPAMTPRRRREILDGRYEDAARSSRIQEIAGAKVTYGPLSDEEREAYAATRERMEQLKKAA